MISTLRGAILSATVVMVGAGLLVYSLTLACYGDEGFHLLAARLINVGKRPYLDFFYQHPPLFAYLTAGWMQLFGEDWRSAHVFSTLCTVASLLLVASYFSSRLGEPHGKRFGGIVAVLLMGSQLFVIQFGTIAQPYGLCLFLIVAAFRLAVVAVERRQSALYFATGLAAGAAAASSLLCAPVAPILLLWVARYGSRGRRVRQSAAFLVGIAVALLPLLWLALHGPRQTLFDLVEYHLFHRGPSFLYYIRWDLAIITGWLESTQAFLRALLAALGLWLVAGRPEWQARRAEIFLCAWLTVGLALYISTAHPILPQYYVLLAPFTSILGSIGVCAIGFTLWTTGRATGPALAAAGLLVVGLLKPTYHGRKSSGCSWNDWEEIGREVNRLTPKDGLMLGPDMAFFAAGRIPPPGLENSNSLGLRLPPDLARSLRIIPETQVDQWVAEGRFDTVCSCATLETAALHGLPGPFTRQNKVKHCYLFWEKRPR